MSVFRGVRQTLRGGAGAGRGDNAHAQPSSASNWNPDAERAQAMANKPAESAQPTGSGRGRYQLEGGGYLRTTPSAGSEGRRHDVTVYSDDHKPQYSVSDASFGHDAETGTAKFFGGKDYSSGDRMGHTWTGKTVGGNIHSDDTPS